MSIRLHSPDDMAAWLCEGCEPAQASISIARLSALVSKALTMDGLEHDADVVLSILIAPLGDYDEIVAQADAAITTGDIYLHGAGWMVGIAEHLGFNGEKDDFVDLAWLAGRPHMAAVHCALSMLAVRAMSAAESAYEAQHGHSMLEVFLASGDTGESFDQSRARLTARRIGLQCVN